MSECVLRCEVSGNPCGTDTSPLDMPCECGPCLAARELESAAIDRALRDGNYMEVDWRAHVITTLQQRIAELEAQLERAHGSMNAAVEGRSLSDECELPMLEDLSNAIDAIEQYMKEVEGE